MHFSAAQKFSTRWNSKLTPLSPLAILGLLVGSGIAFYIFFLLLAFLLREFPEPIGSRANLFVEGARVTLSLTVVSGAIGLVLGAMLGLGKLSAFWLFRLPAHFFVWIIRGTPLLVQIFFVYNALPQILKAIHIDLQFNEYWSAVLALAINIGAYNGEVVRAGILAVPRGQTEAALSLGLSQFSTLTTVVLPQALRIVLPPLVNNLVALLKDSSLAFTIGTVEVTQIASRINAETFQPIETYLTLAFVYLSLTTVLTFFTNMLENWLKLPSR